MTYRIGRYTNKKLIDIANFNMGYIKWLYNTNQITNLSVEDLKTLELLKNPLVNIDIGSIKLNDLITNLKNKKLLNKCEIKNNNYIIDSIFAKCFGNSNHLCNINQQDILKNELINHFKEHHL